ncbi:MAG: serine/threonine protein kinase [Deltaproteobacteria bacterium]|nr:serine/threonine protein kinase [Deltaproteobacteria bacterium]
MLDKNKVIAGKYRLNRVIGEGGIGAVWEATHLTLNSPVAIKFIDCGGPHGAQIADRFLREARISAAVRHRNVVQIMDFGTSDDGPYMVMEYLEGHSLGSEIRQAPMPVARVVEIVVQVLSGLTAVHDAGIVHKDLKPDNIFLVKQSDGYYPKILDFGVSKGIDPISGPSSAVTTHQGALSGTPQYMSPEQARGIRDIDPRSDIYSLGVIMYEALTGKVPYYAEHVGDLIVLVVTGSTPRVIDKCPDIDPALSDFVSKAMARERSERFASSRQMLESLRTLVLRSSTLNDSLMTHTDVTTLSSSFPPAVEPANDKASRKKNTPTDAKVSFSPSSSLQRLSKRYAIVGSIRSRRSLWMGGTLAATVLVAVTFVAIGRSRLKRADAAQAGVTTAQTATAANQQAKKRAASQGTRVETEAPGTPLNRGADTITVRLRGVGQAAEVFLDGERSRTTELDMPRDHHVHRIRVSALGFQPWSVEHIASKDGVYEVEMIALTPGNNSSLKSSSSVAQPRAIKASRQKRSAEEGPALKRRKPGVVRELDF